LNLVFLLHDLRSGLVAQGAWASRNLLCPVAHGMPVGQLVADLQFLGQAAEPDRACAYAARYLGADPRCVNRFVQLWDSHAFSSDWLVRHLEDLWEERRADADAVQELIDRAPLGDDAESQHGLATAVVSALSA